MGTSRITLPAVQSLLILITFISFYPSLHNGWTSWDDDRYVVDNPVVQDISWKTVGEICTTAYVGSYLPVTMFSFMVDYQIGGFDPAVFHWTNLFLHILNTILAFWFLFSLTDDISAAALGALLFGIHPMRVESVAWISGRKDVLAMFFFLVSLLSYVRFVKLKKEWLLTAAFAAFVAAIFSKVIVVTLPLLLLLIDYYVKRDVSAAVIREKVPFFLVSAAMAVVGFMAQKMEGAVKQSVSLLDPAVVSLHGIIFYLQKFIAPVQLSSFYPYPNSTNGSLPSEYYFFALLSGALFVVLWYLRKRPAVVFGASFFIISLLPVLQFIRFSQIFAADRFTYFAYIGLFMLVGMGWSELWQRSHRRWKAVIALCTVAVIGTLSLLTWERTQVWKDSHTLWENVLSQYPDALHGL